MQKKVLITGANGFIGSSLGAFFQKKGFEVIGWDKTLTIKNSFKVKEIDLFDLNLINQELNAERPDIIVHCAGNADVGKSVQDPSADYHGNVTLTHNLLFELNNLNMRDTRFIFLSSAAVYGNPTQLPITENMPLNPLSPYALHKVMCEDICSYFIKKKGMNIKIARLFSAYGAGLKKQIFWDMYKKAKTTCRLDMFGTGNESRDYIHVEDVVQGLYLIATVPHDDNIIFNVANGEEVTIREATEYFANCVGIGLDKIHFNGVEREGDPLNWRADISRLELLGYSKTVEMRTGLKAYYSWVQDNQSEVINEKNYN